MIFNKAKKFVKICGGFGDDADKAKSFMTAHRLTPNEAHNGRSALCVAIRAGNPNIARMLIEEGANTVSQNASNYYGISILDMAMDRSMFDIVQTLLEKGAAVSGTLREKSTLHYLCEARQRDLPIELAQHIIDMTHDINLQSAYGKRTPAMVAVQYKNNGVLRLLCEKGADLSLKDHEGKTAYDLADTTEIRDLLRPYMVRQGIAVHVPLQMQTQDQSDNPARVTICHALDGGWSQIEIYDFAKLRRTTVMNDQNGGFQGSHVENFEDMRDRESLQSAFNEHRRRGGTADETLACKKTLSLDGQLKPKGGACV